MTTKTQENANLTANSYGVEMNDEKGQLDHLVNKNIVLEGVTYKVLEYMDKPFGYQGVIDTCRTRYPVFKGI